MAKGKKKTGGSKPKESPEAAAGEGPVILTPEDIGLSSKALPSIHAGHASRFARGSDQNSKNKGTQLKLKRLMQRNQALWNDAARGTTLIERHLTTE